MQENFSSLNEEQMTVTSIDDITDVLLTKIKGRYRRVHISPQGSLVHSLICAFAYGLFPVGLSGKPQTL